MSKKIWLALVAGVVLIGCPGSLDPKEFLDDGGTGGGSGGGSGTGGGSATGGGSGGCDVEGTLFPMTCANSGACHVKLNTVADGLDLVTAGVKQRLAGTSQCNGLPLKSYMLTKVQSPNPPCGSQMPLGGPFLDSTQIQCLSDYLATIDGGP